MYVIGNNHISFTDTKAAANAVSRNGRSPRIRRICYATFTLLKF